MSQPRCSLLLVRLHYTNCIMPAMKIPFCKIQHIINKYYNQYNKKKKSIGHWYQCKWRKMLADKNEVIKLLIITLDFTNVNSRMHLSSTRKIFLSTLLKFGLLLFLPTYCSFLQSNSPCNNIFEETHKRMEETSVYGTWMLIVKKLPYRHITYGS